MSVYQSQRCVGTTLKGERCKLRTARGTRCWQHMKKHKKLRIKKSGVPNGGLGLYTTERIRKGKSIGKYKGEKMSRAQVDARYRGKRGDYVLCKSKKKCIDGRKSNSSAVRFVNDSRGTKKRNNTKLTGSFTAKATRNIPQNSELFAAYGRDYWK